MQNKMLKLFTLLMITVVIGINAWRVEIPDKDNLGLKIGQITYVSCDALELDDNTTAFIKWFKDGQEVGNEKLKYRGRTKKERNSLSLYFEKPTYEDNGEYMCSVSAAGEVKNVTALLKFKERAGFGAMSTHYYQPEGSEAHVACNVTGDQVKVEWTKGGRQLEGEKYRREGNDLVIEHFQESDAGNYTCLWWQDKDEGKMEVILETYRKPKLVEFPQNMSAFEGKNFTAVCKADGNPVPTVKWQRKTSDVNGLVWESSSYDDINGSLFIEKPSLDHAGFYECTATGKNGDTDSRIMTLTVYSKPTISTMTTMEANKGDTVTLPCTFKGDSKLNASWTHDGAVLIKELFAHSNESHILNLTLSDVQESGIYKCEVSNDGDTVELQTELIVVYPPEIAGDEVEDLYVALNGTVTLMCNAQSFPLPTFSWLHDNDDQTSYKAPEVISDVSPSNSVLTISNIASLPANITCVAENAMGKASKVFTLHQKLTPFTANLTCMAEDYYTLKCFDESAVNATEESSPEFYELYYVQDNGTISACCEENNSLVDCNSTLLKFNYSQPLKIFDLKSGQTYFVQILAVNSAGRSKLSNCAKVEMPREVNIWLVILYIIVTLLALALLIDVLCCLLCNKGVLARTIRHLRNRRFKAEYSPTKNDRRTNQSEKNLFVEEDYVYEEESYARAPLNV